MKKTIIISAATLAIFSLLAFTFISTKNSTSDNIRTASIEASPKVEENSNKQSFPDFIYGIGTRFNPIKKEDVIKATSVHSFYTETHIDNIKSVKNVTFIKVENEVRTDKSETGNSITLTNNHIDFFKNLDYSSSFVMKMDYYIKSDLTERTSTPHYTIVPETQAQYIYGKDALIKYFTENTKHETANIPEDKLKPAKLYFTVTKNGTVNNIKLDRSSGYSNIDELMIGLISETPGGWIPALNVNGETVEQELVVFFGLMDC